MRHRVAVAGASGYAGGELVRLLAGHPDFDLGALAAYGSVGQRVGAVHPNLRGLADRSFCAADPAAFADADLVFLALPHGSSAHLAAALDPGQRVVELGSDHRLVDERAHARYYGGTFAETWTYGLPELPGQRANIAAATRVANTGCHAVAAILAIAPVLRAGLAEPEDIVVTSISGTSGAGRAAAPHLLASEIMGDLSAYKVGAHRHVPEIEQASGARGLTMTPVLAPLPRGILSSAALRPAREVDEDSVRSVLAEAYAAEPFVHLLPAGQQPHTAATAASNSAQLQAVVDENSGRIVVTCAIDNLGKGAAGQAIQNANLMLGVPETAGLSTDGIAP